nr:hypothetical protein [Tanacetum cinerariifolium]
KFVRNPNKPPDSSQRPPHDCLKCGNPVDGLHCRQCALLRKKLKEVWFAICDEHKNFQDFLNTSESSNDNTNVVNAPQEPFIFNQDPGENYLQSPPHIDHHCCYGCGDSLDGIVCPQCTCESCGNGAHYGYNCPTKVLIISNPEPCHNQNVKEFPQTLPSFVRRFKLDYNNDKIKWVILILILPSLLNVGRFPFTTMMTMTRKILLLREILLVLNFLCVLQSHLFYPPRIPKDSLIMRDGHLDTNPEKESDEFIKSSVENLVPNPSDFEDLSNIRQSLLNQDSSIISSSKIDSLLDEFAGELIFLKSIPPGIDEADCDPEEEIRDILILEEFLSNDSLSLPENESFHFDIPSSPRPLAKPSNDDEIEPDSGSLTVKVVGDISEHYVLMPRILPTQPTLASNKEKSLHLLSHRGFKAFHLSSKSSMI